MKPTTLIAALFAATVGLTPTALPADAPAKAPNTLVETFTVLDPNVWGTRLRPGSSVEVVKGGVAVKNRAYLISKDDYTGSLEIETKIAYEDKGGGRAYADVALVTWKSTGKVAGGTDELQDGLQVRMVFGDGFVQLQENGSNRSVRSEVVELVKDPKKAAWPAGTYTLRIKDEKGKVTVTVAEGDKKPFTEVTTDKLAPTPLPGKKIVLGNRNRTAEYDMSGRFGPFSIKPLTPKKD